MSDPATVEDQRYKQACDHVTRTGTPTAVSLLGAGFSYNGAIAFLERMEQDGIITAPDGGGRRTVIAKAP